MDTKKNHWENIYQSKPANQVSWFQPHLAKSLESIASTRIDKEARIIDVGGGASALVDDLMEKGFKNITVVDISSEALKVSKGRLGDRAGNVQWIEGNVTQVSLTPNYYDLWHDRAVFHFLVSPEDRRKYIESLTKSLKFKGYLLMATFGPNGPLKCSGLEIVRYSSGSLQKELGDAFHLEKEAIEIHKTPFDTAQEFLYCLFQKI